MDKPSKGIIIAAAIGASVLVMHLFAGSAIATELQARKSIALHKRAPAVSGTERNGRATESEKVPTRQAKA